MKVAAVFFADGFEDVEALTPVDYLRRAGLQVITVGVKGKPYNDSMIVTSSHDVRIITDTNLETYLRQYGEQTPDCVLCPGGSRGAENLSSGKSMEQQQDCSCYLCQPCCSFGKNNYSSRKKVDLLPWNGHRI